MPTPSDPPPDPDPDPAAAPAPDAARSAADGGAPERAGRRAPDETARTRAAILDAAEALFARHGFEGASMRAIAERAGVTHGLLRHHFGGKDGLWRAVIERAVADYAAAYAPVVARLEAVGSTGGNDDGSGAERASDMCRLAARGFARTSRERPALMRLLVHEGSEPGPRLEHVLRCLEPLLARLEPLFESARSKGALRAFPGARPFDLFLICALGTPFAMPAFSAALLGDAGAAEGGGGAIPPAAADAYVEAVVAALFGPEPPRAG